MRKSTHMTEAANTGKLKKDRAEKSKQRTQGWVRLEQVCSTIVSIRNSTGKALEVAVRKPGHGAGDKREVRPEVTAGSLS